MPSGLNNVAGAGSDELGDVGAFNLIPMTLRSLTQGQRPQIFGNDYATPDGTCIRDYIHVSDLADAHIAAVKRTEARVPFEVYNIGRGVGSSVSEVMKAISAAVGRDVNPEVVQRRPGDPAIVVASVELARDQLHWTATLDLDAMVTSAWSAWQANPPEGS